MKHLWGLVYRDLKHFLSALSRLESLPNRPTVLCISTYINNNKGLLRLKNVALKSSKPRDLDSYREGRDELNLAEFPLATISDRFLDGTKTVVICDQVWDRDRREHVPRKLTISGSDRYGLPVAKDDDVLLACVQLSSMVGFADRRVDFTRYELLKLLRWPQDSKSYRRLAPRFAAGRERRVYSDRTFYDHGRKSWVNRDFGIFDNLFIYEREERTAESARSWFVWNEVIFDSFQAGYLKALDWDLYCRSGKPGCQATVSISRQTVLPRWRSSIDLHELAFRKLTAERILQHGPNQTGAAQGHRGTGIALGIAIGHGATVDSASCPVAMGSRVCQEEAAATRRPQSPRLNEQSQSNQSLEVTLTKRGVWAGGGRGAGRRPSAGAHPNHDRAARLAQRPRARSVAPASSWPGFAARSRIPGRRGFRPSRQSVENSRIRPVREKPKQASQRERRNAAEIANWSHFWRSGTSWMRRHSRFRAAGPCPGRCPSSAAGLTKRPDERARDGELFPPGHSE